MEAISCTGRTARRTAMGMGDRIHNAAERLHGKGMKAAGELSGNDRMRAEGKGRVVRANLKQAGEKIKHAFKRH
jgi:uncharacterized protein YjbJ (UPF0337 family)